MTRSHPESAPDIAALASALADPTRVMICMSLLDGRAWTLTELSRSLVVPMSSTSEHASILVDRGVLAERRQGRHRYVQLARGWVDDTATVTDSGCAGLTEVWGISVPSTASVSRPLTRRCLDWTERRTHLGGWLGDAVCEEFLDRTWIVRHRNSRALTLTPTGRDELDWILAAEVTQL